MDIRFINSKNELINVSNLSIKVINNSLVGIDVEKNVVVIEDYEHKEETEKVLKRIVEMINKSCKDNNNITDVLFDLRQ